MQPQARNKYPLLPYSKIVLEHLRENPTAHWHTWHVRFSNSSVDAERLRQAMETALRCHPIFEMEVDEDGNQYRVERKDILEGLFHRVQIEEIGDEIVLHLSLNRILGDELGKQTLMTDIFRAYNGEPLEEDRYWEWIEEQEAKKQTERYRQHQTCLEDEFGTVDYPVMPHADIREQIEQDGLLLVGLDEYEGSIKLFEQEWLLSLNGLMTLATGLAIMETEQTGEAGLTWAYHGRETEQEQRIYGSLHRDIPIGLKQEGIPEMIRQVRKKLRDGIANSDYAFTLLQPKESPWHKAVNVIVDPSWKETESCLPIGAILTEDEERIMPQLDVEIYEQPLRMQLRYNAAEYSEQRIRQFAELIVKNIKEILKQRKQ